MYAQFSGGNLYSPFSYKWITRVCSFFLDRLLIHVYVNNLAAMKALNSNLTIFEIKISLRLSHLHKFELIWVIEHHGIEGNENTIEWFWNCP